MPLFFKQIGTNEMRVLFIILMFLTSCAEPMQHGQSNDRPEVIIRNAEKIKIKESLVNGMLNRGYSVTKSDDIGVTVEKPITGFGAIIYGSRFNSTPNARIVFSVLQLNKDVRIVADMTIVTNPNSGAEYTRPANNAAGSDNIRKFLNDLAAEKRN